jgi:hypothetical protein
LLHSLVFEFSWTFVGGASSPRLEWIFSGKPTRVARAAGGRLPDKPKGLVFDKTEAGFIVCAQIISVFPAG